MSSLAADTAAMTTCANCSKAEADGCKLKRCTACKMVKYCCRDCQVAHRPKHIKACKKRAAELFDEELFKDPPDQPECPICMLPMPLDRGQIMFQLCCGKTICKGCIHAQTKEDIKSGKRWDDVGACAFCREPGTYSDEEEKKRLKKLMEKGNAKSLYVAASLYTKGERGFCRNPTKAIELFTKSADLGCTDAYVSLGSIYEEGYGVGRDVKKARYYFELGAIGGSIDARHNLACLDKKDGDIERASKHFVICAKAGYELSLPCVKRYFKDGIVTKDEYAEVLRAYQKQQEDRKSAMRDEVKGLLEGSLGGGTG